MTTKKYVVVTGASAGIGRAIALEMAMKGYTPILVARTEDTLRQLVEEIKADTELQAWYFVCDMANLEQVNRLSKKIIKVTEHVDVLINNAGGVAKSATFNELDINDWQTVFNVNFFSVVELVNGLLCHFNKKGGKIINVSSINGRVPGHYNPHYSAAKAALNNLTQYLSVYLGKAKVTVNSVSPGIIKTPGWEDNIVAMHKGDADVDLLDEMEREAGKTIPAGRLGTDKEVAKLVSFVASDEVAYINGSDFVIDGGKRREI